MADPAIAEIQSIQPAGAMMRTYKRSFGVVRKPGIWPDYGPPFVIHRSKFSVFALNMHLFSLFTTNRPVFRLNEDDIPDEVWLTVLTFVASHPKYLNQLRLVSRRFKRYCEEDYLWFLTFKSMSPNLSHGIAYKSLSYLDSSWKQMFQDHWKSLQSWGHYTPKSISESILFQLPFYSSLYGPQWKHLVQSENHKEFRHVSRRLIEDHANGLVGYGGCVDKERYNVLVWSKNDWRSIGNYQIPIEGEQRVELISVNAKRGLFVIAYGNSQLGSEWSKIQIYRMDNGQSASKLVEFRMQVQASFHYGGFEVPYSGESNPNAFTLFGVESNRNAAMFSMRFDYLSGELISKHYFLHDIQVLNYHPGKADHLLFLTTSSGEVRVWDLRNDQNWLMMTNGSVNPWGTEPTILFDHDVDKQAIKLITVGDNEIDSNYLVLWELFKEKNGTQRAQMIYQVEVKARDGVFGSYCVHGSCLLGLTYDGTIMVYHLENLTKLAAIPIPSKYDFGKQSGLEELYDISVNDMNQITVCTSRGLFMSPLPSFDPDVFIIGC
ncbi:hypothetical protein K493DRAFT_303248 [Basidiobolus meristosporus CBS 931.73]|uniref:F-box domain-containing protein n=1 Tax=Basidiobolus meristosporus CBS 931.73 TaxID=1314790 RepID=A0A1Y1Y4R1_9FUNG|nr:hypothetical protein K493DRAFT_303248 [Basidiobolus meristosporus CBS 931.73]|eukprot:ORX92594.1 hypothetical protein K493DRAFT_303248 [Basidiobolus meristosporus CBS 931.73]